MTGNKSENIARGAFNMLSWEHDMTFASRETGYDLYKEEDIQRLVDESVNYDVFINSSLLKDFAQTILLQRVWTEWKSNQKEGQIISIGSSADYFQRADNKLYPIEKRALRDLSKSLSLHCTWHDSKIKISYFAIGGVDTPKTRDQWPHIQVHSIEQICKMIKWILDAPLTMNIDELHITPIQLLDKGKLAKTNPKRNVPPKFESGDGRVYTKL